ENSNLYRHSHESGNLETQSCKNLSEMTETQRTWIPAFAGMTGVWRECRGFGISVFEFLFL
ncbi:TPA: hypothetical protein ACLRJ8_002094, partial [Neisseria meningitidis]